MHDPSRQLTINIDGASRGNPGPAAYAVVVTAPSGEAVASFAKTLGIRTNNFAEYQALLAALRYALQNANKKIVLRSDSELLVRQIQGKYKVKSSDLKPLHEEALAMIRQIDSFTISHVAREANREADRLANRALDGTLAGSEREPESRGDSAPDGAVEPAQGDCAPSSPRPAVAAPLTALSEEERMFQAAAFEFASKEIAPAVREMDRDGVFRRDLLDQFFAQGFMGISVPERFGGGGGNFFMSILAVESFARVDASASVIIDVQNTLVENALLRWGTEEQKTRYLPRLVSESVGAYALSEPRSGSDAFALETRAKAGVGCFVLDGRKLWITNAHEAALFIVFATVDRQLGYRGITAFLVERETPGFTVGRKEDKLGIRASSTCELLLDGCRVPRESVLGEIGSGYRVAIETLNEGRIGIAAQMTGIAQGAFDHALAYAKERRQFGKAIADFQAVQFQLARLATGIEATRLMTYNAARLKDADSPFAREAAMAKYFASEIAERTASEAVEILGGYGYTKDYPVEKYLRDAKIGKIYEGTSFMQLQTIAKIILGKS
ncbi:MAG: acyl-CoA dehydrogenase family protein [Terriglobia bacterium]